MDWKPIEEIEPCKHSLFVFMMHKPMSDLSGYLIYYSEPYEIRSMKDLEKVEQKGDCVIQDFCRIFKHEMHEHATNAIRPAND